MNLQCPEVELLTASWVYATTYNKERVAQVISIKEQRLFQAQMKPLENKFRSTINWALGRPYVSYELRLKSGLTPLRLDFAMEGMGQKEFIFVPKGRLKEILLKSGSVYYSEGLREYYRYIDSTNGRIIFPQSRGNVWSDFYFDIVRWNSTGTVQFPRLIPCAVNSRELELTAGVEQILFAVQTKSGRK